MKSSEQTPGKPEKTKKRGLEHWQGIAALLMLYDVVVVNLSYLLVLWLRFECHANLIPKSYVQSWMKFVPIYTVFCLAVFLSLNLYKSLWRFAS